MAIQLRKIAIAILVSLFDESINGENSAFQWFGSRLCRKPWFLVLHFTTILILVSLWWLVHRAKWIIDILLRCAGFSANSIPTGSQSRQSHFDLRLKFLPVLSFTPFPVESDLERPWWLLLDCELPNGCCWHRWFCGWGRSLQRSLVCLSSTSSCCCNMAPWRGFWKIPARLWPVSTGVFVCYTASMMLYAELTQNLPKLATLGNPIWWEVIARYIYTKSPSYCSMPSWIW